jgi:hypothetical protein
MQRGELVMAMQRTTGAGTNAPVEPRYRPSLRARAVPVPRHEATVAEQIEHLPDDHQRAVFCRGQAEAFRRQWFAGMQREMAYVMTRADDGDPRFRNMTYAQLEMTARWRWSQSSRGQHLMQLEGVFTNWARMYLSFAGADRWVSRTGPPD